MSMLHWVVSYCVVHHYSEVKLASQLFSRSLPHHRVVHQSAAFPKAWQQQ